MRHRLVPVLFLWVLGWTACAVQAPAPTVPSLPSPTGASTRSFPTPSRVSAPTNLPPRTATSSPVPATPRPGVAPLPDGFQTDGDWLAIFRPSIERQTWREGDVWLTDGQRWIGPWPSFVGGPFWTSHGEQLQFCYWQEGEWIFELAKSDIPPICVDIPKHLNIHPTHILEEATAKVLRCGEDAICIRLPDQRTSAPIRLPIPKEILQGKRPFWEELPVYVECIAPDWRHAILVVPRLGGPLGDKEELLGKADPSYEPPPMAFPGAVYWVDLQSGEVRGAPTNAPAWPDQQALVRSMAKEGRFPPSYVSFFKRTLLGPTIEGTGGYYGLWTTGCSPSRQFALILQGIWHNTKEVYFPSDAKYMGGLLSRAPDMAPVLALWVIRLEDGTGYPLTIVEELFHDALSERVFTWVPYYPPEDLTSWILMPPRPPTHPLPPEFHK